MKLSSKNEFLTKRAEIRALLIEATNYVIGWHSINRVETINLLKKIQELLSELEDPTYYEEWEPGDTIGVKHDHTI